MAEEDPQKKTLLSSQGSHSDIYCLALLNLSGLTTASGSCKAKVDLQDSSPALPDNVNNIESDVALKTS